MTKRRRVARKRPLRPSRWLGRLRAQAQWLRRARGGIIGALCGIALAGAVWYALPRSARAVTLHPYFALSDIHVNGNRRLSRDEILRWADVHEGVSVWSAAPSAVAARLQSHPWVRRAAVQRRFPHSLTISITERRPAAIARLDRLYYVDRSGHLLSSLQADDSPDFPLITGLEGADTRAFTGLGLRRALRLLRLCEKMKCVDGVSEIHVDRHRGVTLVPLRTPVAMVLGWGNWREKLARSARVLAAWQGQIERLAAVDVSFRDLAVVKLREGPHPTVRRAAKRGLRV